MKKILRRILYKPIVYLTNRFTSKPGQERIESSLNKLLEELREGNDKKGLRLTLGAGDKYIIFSDHHKGAKDGADDFALAEPTYLAALDHYYDNGYNLISLGDSEELWENSWLSVKKHNTASFRAEAKFIARQAFIKIVGNHDIFWMHDPLAGYHLKSVYGSAIDVYEGLLFKCSGVDLEILLAHGHQGDLRSDSNAFSSWFVSTIWAPLQSYLCVNFNTPATVPSLKSLHNAMMYDWSRRQPHLALITGHTHQPVFCSLTYIERLHLKLEKAMEANNTGAIMQLQKQIRDTWGKEPPQSLEELHVIPSYFNAGCCCYNDGDITGIELTGSTISLVKWTRHNVTMPTRLVLEEASLANIAQAISDATGISASPGIAP